MNRQAEPDSPVHVQFRPSRHVTLSCSLPHFSIHEMEVMVGPPYKDVGRVQRDE